MIAGLDARSAAQTRDMLADVRDEDRRRLLDGMRVITEVLTESPQPRGYLLRAPQPGDMGWVVQRNGAVYAEEFGWDASYEALVARIVADYVNTRDPECEAAWIAEVDGAPAGCVFCVREDEQHRAAAAAAGRAVGQGPRDRRPAGRGGAPVRPPGRVPEITLWTNDVLAGARRIYQRAGFTLDDESRHHSFGKDLVGQNWSRRL